MNNNQPELFEQSTAVNKKTKKEKAAEREIKALKKKEKAAEREIKALKKKEKAAEREIKKQKKQADKKRADFLSGKDIIRPVDYKHLDKIVERLSAIIQQEIHPKVNVHYRQTSVKDFCGKNIADIYRLMKENNLINGLNNHGRSPEEVFTFWFRGNAVVAYFNKVIAHCFGVYSDTIKTTGTDDCSDITTFKRSSKSDLQIVLSDGKKINIEVQSAWQGKSHDIKLSKIKEAKKHDHDTILMHFDIYNMRVALINLKTVDVGQAKSNGQLNGAITITIQEDWFRWNLCDAPPKYSTVLV